MKILYLAHRIPYPPDKGEKIRAFNQIKYLSRKHEIHLACFIDRERDLAHVETLREWCASVETVYRGRQAAKAIGLLGLFGSRSLSVASFWSKKLNEKVRVLLRKVPIDRIVVSSTPMAEYVRHVAEIPKILDLIDVDSEKWRLYAKCHGFPLSWLYRLEANRLAAYEDEMTRLFDHAALVSETEAELLRARVKDRPVAVVSVGVDFEYYAPEPPLADGEPVPKTIVFTGMMDYFPNVDAVCYFCEEIFPRVREDLPEARFTIVGRNPTSAVRKLENQPGVEVTGEVPDVRPYVGKAGVSVAPFRLARGLQTKILESMALAVPVVGTLRAFQGLRATESDGVRMAAEPAEFAKQVVGLLTDADLRRECSSAARRYVETNHQWNDINAKLEALLTDELATLV